MKKFKKTAFLIGAMLVTLSLAITSSEAQSRTTGNGHGWMFIDLNGDGFNDHALDADGDGIPNGQDPDYLPGMRHASGHGNMMGHGNWFIDLNGDGFNDNAPDADGDGIPNGQDPDYVPGSGCNNPGFQAGWQRGHRYGNRHGGMNASGRFNQLRSSTRINSAKLLEVK